MNPTLDPRPSTPVQAINLEIEYAALTKRRTTETAASAKNRVYPHARRGSPRNFASARISTPPAKPAFSKMKDLTHSELRKVQEQNCASKSRYNNSQAAHDAIHGLVHRRGRKRQKNLRTYHCPVCEGWHLTS